ncbi:hypothetical protein EST38_g5698 [Candolleomyces aberdarensis]|uniref:Transcription initiation factor TFIID subunit 4 n=1 Tax=Candolleomyces aberdarensis TaxID=2316362 RepID=A0A4Q2DLJ4_9AGAR|nr:hypothetical protein EST38_g5698 [Candolleomyces aberdarensis]
MSTSAVKSDPDSAASNQAATTTTTSITPITTTASTPVSLPTNMSAGTPVQTYPSPAHAQWAASQMVIDPQLQQQSATSAATTQRPQHAATPQATPTAAQTALAQSYYSYYPQYQYSYLTAAAQQHAASAAHSQTTAATSHAHTQAATQRASFSVTPTPATPAPVTAAQGYTPAPATATSLTANQANNNALDTSDIATLNDALGSAGVDLRAEEESLQRHDLHIPSHLSTTSSIYIQRTYEDRSRKQPIKPMFNTQTLGATMRSIGTQHKVSRIPEDSVNYLALALRARLQDLITAMIEASQYRKDAQFDRPASMYEALQPGQGDTQTPMWSISVRSDVAKQLAVLERIEREDEMRIRRERKERLEMAAQHAANLAAQVSGGGLVAPDGTLNPGVASLAGTSAGMGDDMDGQPKKKKKKDGPGVTARNMSEDVRKKMSNAVATQAAGLGKYSWMTASASATPQAKKPAAASSTPAGTPAKDGSGSGGASSWARPYVPKKPTAAQSATTTTTPNAEEDPNRIVVTMRDAMFVIEKERGHGGGRGSAKGWK